MSISLNKKTILKKTAHMGVLSIISKILGIIRESLQIKYLGVNEFSDAFNVAFRVPNMLRKVFAEGALSAAFIPTLVNMFQNKEDKQVSKLMTLMIMVIGVLVLLTCLAFFIWAKPSILAFAPGFVDKPIELSTATMLLRILIYFIFFVSMAALFAGAMQAKNQFIVPSWGPIILNVIYIGGLVISLWYGLSVEAFSYSILLGGLVQAIIFGIFYMRMGFSFALPDKHTMIHFSTVMLKFLPCVLTMSVTEINFLIDQVFASSLPSGSITLINLATKYMGIILSAFSTGFSSILFSHLSRVTVFAPKRLGFYLLESSKFMLWVTLPVTFLMWFFSYDIFYTMFYKITGNITLEQTSEASQLLIGFISVLFFYSLNKLLLSIYYSLHRTFLPTAITFVATFLNIILNRMLIPKYGAVGLAYATSAAAVLQTILFIWMCHRELKITLYFGQFLNFMIKYFVQLFCVGSLFYILYKVIVYGLALSAGPEGFFLKNIGLWMWVGPLSLMMFGVLYVTKRLFKIKLYFLE